MNQSPAFLHALEIADLVTFTVREVPVCDRGHVGCWRVTATAGADLHGKLRTAVSGPYLHLSLMEALDVVATVAAYHGSQLELLDAARNNAAQLALPLDVQAEE